MQPHLSRLTLALLLLGALLNLGAGARRPLRERALVREAHHGAMARAAEAVRRHAPPGSKLTLVGYDGDFLGALDCAVWADYRLRWLLYPRPFETVRYGAPPDPGHGFRLFFRVTAPPVVSGRPKVIVSEPMFVLAAEEK